MYHPLRIPVWALFLALISCSKSDDSFFPQSFEDLEGHRMAIMEGSVQADYSEAHLRDKGVTLIYYPNFADAMLAVRQGKADLVFSNIMATFNEAFQKQHLTISHAVDEIDAPIGFGVKKGNDALREELNAFIDSLKQCGSDREIFDRWLSSANTDFHDTYRIDPVPANPTGEGKILRVGVSGSNPPATILLDNKWTGFEIEILQRFAAARGYQLQISAFDFHNLIPAVSTGTIDVIASTLIMNAERAKKIDFTVETYKLLTAFVVNDPDYTEKDPFWDSVKDSCYTSFIKEQRWRLIVNGLWVTILITLCSLLLGSALGGGICYLRLSRKKWQSAIAKAYIYIMRNTPMLVFLMIMFYVILGKSGLQAVTIAIIAFSLNSAAFVAEIFRSGIQSVDKGQTEAGRAIGCSAFKTFLYIVAPQAAKNIAPVYTNECITLLKGTAIVGYISIIDLTKASDLIRSSSFEVFFPLLLITLVYFLLAGLITAGLNKLVKHL